MKKSKFKPLAEDRKKDLITLYRQALDDGLDLEEIEHKVSKMAERIEVAEKKEEEEVIKKDKNYRLAIPKMIRWGAAILPTILLLLGIGLVGSATLPIVGYSFNNFSENITELKSPVPDEDQIEVVPLVLAQTIGEDGDFGTAVEKDSGPIIIDEALDYTDLSNWFDGSGGEIEAPNLTDTGATGFYTIDIPAINVENARVSIGGTDLNKSLIQYPGTALPGKLGAPVIFGHSILRQFYNPKESNPRRYNSIFSYIMTLKKGDKIYVTKNNVRYTYVVQNKTEVKPTDTYILNQQYDSRQLKLVTCVPEGTYLRRGIITAQLVKEA